MTTGQMTEQALAQLRETQAAAPAKDPLQSRRNRLAVAEGDLATCEATIAKTLEQLAELEADLVVLYAQRRDLAEEVGRHRGHIEARRLNGDRP